MRFYSIMWDEGRFQSTATVLAFTSKKAREVYPLHCARRVESINSISKKEYLKEGYPLWLMLWDSDNPSKFYERK